MKDIRALIITGFGINCEEEMAAAYRLVGATAEIVHLNDIFMQKVSIHDYDICNFPGGFSFGDDLGSGKVLANKMKYKKLINGKLFFKELEDFISDGKYILGVCNGFQFLVKMGLLPNLSGDYTQEVTLTYNDSSKFEDRWCFCKVEQTNTPFLNESDLLHLPVRHGEGKLVISDEMVRRQISDNNLNCMSYADEKSNVTSNYPANPNGSDLNCAALTDRSGHILGMMPHPEAYLSLFNHPDWHALIQKDPHISHEGDGLKIFRNIVEHIKQERR